MAKKSRGRSCPRSFNWLHVLKYGTQCVRVVALTIKWKYLLSLCVNTKKNHDTALTSSLPIERNKANAGRAWAIP